MNDDQEPRRVGRPSKPKDIPVVASRIRTARENAGLSQEEAAKRAGMAQSYLSRLELGSKGVTLDTLHSIATAWGVDPSDLDPRLTPAIRESAELVGLEGGPLCPSTITLRPIGLTPTRWKPDGKADQACLRGLSIANGLVITGLDPEPLKARGVRRLVLEME